MMGMNKKQYEECFDRLDKYVFSRDLAVKEDWYDLLKYHQQQLQAYKNKEDKLRKTLQKHTPANEDIILYEIKQIPDEGSEE